MRCVTIVYPSEMLRSLRAFNSLLHIGPTTANCHIPNRYSPEIEEVRAFCACHVRQ